MAKQNIYKGVFEGPEHNIYKGVFEGPGQNMIIIDHKVEGSCNSRHPKRLKSGPEPISHLILIMEQCLPPSIHYFLQTKWLLMATKNVPATRINIRWDINSADQLLSVRTDQYFGQGILVPLPLSGKYLPFYETRS